MGLPGGRQSKPEIDAPDPFICGLRLVGFRLRKGVLLTERDLPEAARCTDRL